MVSYYCMQMRITACRNGWIVVPFFILCRAKSYAGYEAQSYIDGCRSADGRFQITVTLNGLV